MNIKKVSTGIVFIIISILLALYAFYFLEVEPELAKRKDGQQVQEGIKTGPLNGTGENEKKIMEEKNKEQKKIVIDYKDGKNTLTEVKNKVEDGAKSVDVKSKEKAKGFLWVDRKSSKYVVTLGKKNGLSIGSKLIVFQNDQKLGKVEVDAVYDTIAYVHLIDISNDLTDDDYYRVQPE